MGQTQNTNESLHSIIWHLFPKAKYVGQKSIEASTALAVSTFNEGKMVLASVLNAMSISPSYSTLLHFCRRDHARNHKRDRPILESPKRRRRQLQTRSIAAESSGKRRTKTGSASTYRTGKFGTEIWNPRLTVEKNLTLLVRFALIVFVPLDVPARLTIGWGAISVSAGSTVNVLE